MIKKLLKKRVLIHFDINPLVKAFIYSEIFIWSGWNLIAPIFSIFVAHEVSGGSIEIAATAYSTHLVVRVLFELLSGKYLAKADDFHKLTMAITGIFITGLAYLGFVGVTSIIWIYIFHSLSGIGLGIASPAKNSLFSAHLDKEKETTEWGIHDAAVFTGIALSAAMGGIIAEMYGFPILFLLGAGVIWLGMVPYLVFLWQTDPDPHRSKNWVRWLWKLIVSGK